MPAYRLNPPHFDEAQYFLEVDLGLSGAVKYFPHRDNGQYTLDVCIRMQEAKFRKLVAQRDKEGIWESFRPQKME